MSVLIFDIETGPLPNDDLKRMLPEFDPDSVKLGNTKDKDKIREKIAAARIDHYAKHVEKAALSALTGRVIVVGYQFAGGESVIEDLSERDALETFWARYKWAKQNKASLIGWNIFNFDLPFLIRRSWFHGIQVPKGLLKNNRYWNDTFVDLMQIWACGTYGQWEKLDNAAKFFGGEGKNGNGADFHRLWEEDRPAAVAYLECDLEMTELVATSMGVC